MKFTDEDFAASVISQMGGLLGAADKMREEGATGVRSTRVSGGPGHKGVDIAVSVGNERLRWYVNARSTPRRKVVSAAVAASTASTA